jgi:hypothetical protein
VRLVQFNAKEAQPFADARANARRPDQGIGNVIPPGFDCPAAGKNLIFGSILWASTTLPGILSRNIRWLPQPTPP